MEQCKIKENENTTEYKYTGKVTKTSKNLPEKENWFKRMKALLSKYQRVEFAVLA